VTGLAPGSTTSYDIYSRLSNWISAASTTVTATTAPAAPTSISLANGGGAASAFVDAVNKSSLNVDVAMPSTSSTSDSVHLTIGDGTSTVTATPLAATTGAGTVHFTGLNVSGLNDATLSFTSWSVGGGGTSSTATATFIKDTAAPSPVVTSPTSGSYLKSQTPSITGTAGAQAADASHSADNSTVTVKIYSGGSATGTPVQTLTGSVSGGAWSVTPTSLAADQQYTIQATQGDAAGNSGSSNSPSFVIDTSAPSVAITSPGNNAYTNNQRPTISGTAGQASASTSASADSTNISVAIYSGSTVSGTPLQTLTTTESGGVWSATPTSNLPANAQYTVQASQSDGAGNQGQSSAASFVVDAAAPSPAVTAPSSATGTTTPTISGTAGAQTADSSHSADASTVTVRLFSGATATGTPLQTFNSVSASGGTWSVTAAAVTANAQYTAQVTQADVAGNSGSAVQTFVVDTVAPVVTLTAPASNANTTPTPTYSGAAGNVAASATASADSSTITVKVYAGTTATGTPTQTLSTTASGGSWSVTGTTALPPGRYTAQASQSDGAGNVGTSSASSFTVQPTIHISMLSGTAARQNAQKYGATVNVSVVDNTGAAVANVVVAGSWSPASSGAASTCTTDASGTCSIVTSATQFANPTNETWTVSSLAKSGDIYQPSADVKESIAFNCQSSTCTAN
jgi:hypothetical protein